MKPLVNDTVRLTESMPDEELSEGAIWVIVLSFDKPREAYEVEFCNPRGETVAQVVLRPEQFVVVR
jgi:hypothetical protein